MSQSWIKAHDSSKNTFWENYPSIDSPITDNELNRNEVSVDTIDDRVITLDTTKAEQSDLLLAFKDYTIDETTGIITFTRFNNTTKSIDTSIEKIATNFRYIDDPTDPHYQYLELTLLDGSKQYVDLRALLNQYEFTDSSTIDFSVDSSGNVTASVIDGSITESKLQPNFLADCRAAKAGAESAEADAIAKALVSEGYANGKQNGVPVTSESPYYHNNAEYFKDQASSIVGSKVDSFNGRTGVVTSQSGDYSQDQISVPTGASAGQVPIVANVGGSLKFTMGTPSAGLLPHLTIEADPNTTVTVAKGGTTIVATETSSGIYDCDVDSYGTWVISSVRSGASATLNLDVDTVKSYYIDASYYFLSTITVAYPTGATVVCTDNDPVTPTEYTATESPYTFNFNAVGTWYIKMTYNNITKIVATHNITATGQTFTDNLNWDKTTLQGVQRILDFQIEVGQLNIGDEVGVLESNVSVPYLVTAIDLYNSHEVIFSRKYLLSESKDIGGINYSVRSAVTNYLTSIYNSINASDRLLLKEKIVKYENGSSTGQVNQKLWLPTQQESGFSSSTEYNLGNRTFALFATQAGRVKQLEGGTNQIWQTASSNSYTQVICWDSSGSVVGKGSGSYYVLPCFRLTADS